MYWYNLTDLLPPVYANLKSMFAASDSENTELLEIMSLLAKVKDNFFIQTCDIQTLQYWENLLDIELYGSETIEERREMVLTYLMSNQPITEPFIKETLNKMFGQYHWAFEHDENNYLKIRISIFDTSYDQIRRFKQWFGKVCPAHIDWHTYHAENTQATNYISANTTNHNVSKTSCTMSYDSEVLYLGENSYTINTLELS